MTHSTEQAAVQSAACFQPRRLGHVNLWVDELQRAEDFYSHVCGLKVEFTEPDLVATFLGTGHTPHDLGMMETTKGVNRYGRDGLLQLPGTIGLAPGLNHLAWELENEAELVAGWKRANEQAREIDMTVDHQVAHSVYMFDPDGNYNEFYCDTIKDWRSVLSGPMELLTSRWDPAAQAPFTEGRYDSDPVLETVAGAPVQPRRITHAVLRTAQLTDMVDFYTQVGGLRLLAQTDDVVYLQAGLSDYEYSLVLVRDEQAAFSHGSFELGNTDELEQALARLQARGIVPALDVSLPWKRAFFLRDPDGLLSEWYVPLEGERALSQQHAWPLWAQV